MSELGDERISMALTDDDRKPKFQKRGLTHSHFFLFNETR